ncbi:MAG: MarP family serine protease [Chloroflexota bacterium]
MNPVDLLAIGLLVFSVILGARSGALPQLGGLVGAGVGVAGALNLIPLLRPYLDGEVAALRIGAVLTIVLLSVGIGEMTGARFGRHLSGRLGGGLLGLLDRLTGAVVGAGQGVLIVWLLGGTLATGLLPTLRRDAQTSVAVRAIDVFLPAPEELIIGLTATLDQSGLPDVFLGLERLPADPVALPGSSVVARLGQRALGSTPRIEANACDYRSTGSGVVVKAGYIVTNAHVVAGSRSIRVVTSSGSFKAVLVFFDPRQDIAVLKVAGLQASPLFMAAEDPVRGATGATVGYPNGGAAAIEPAAVTATYTAEGLDIYGAARVPREVIELRADVLPGDSGGPLILTDGTVGGIVFAKSRADAAVGYALSPTTVAATITPALGSSTPVAAGPCLH